MCKFGNCTKIKTIELFLFTFTNYGKYVLAGRIVFVMQQYIYMYVKYAKLVSTVLGLND